MIEFVTSIADKLKSRPYRDEKEVDTLKDAAPAFQWGYIEPGQDLTDPKLSVGYAKRESLPKWLFFVGAEYDLLCRESKEMIMDFMELEGKERDDAMYEFEKGTVKWKMVRGVVHGYTHWTPGGNPADKEFRVKRREETFEEVGEWLFGGPIAEATPRDK
ncbi:hypothetical protein G7Y89_g6470 [Cudoniella acicularis]|uniref:Alpha/beta hydrolase fold-3 domain-containing protein n=1 Tax=Cudoniella acicularis TaxID=354080 RepID=A0A8H4W2Z4_9HELO|nr:hypothetical protein G7Y89_g6470 [Cudoniella acicularis]